jgi:hypothetical protein
MAWLGVTRIGNIHLIAVSVNKPDPGETPSLSFQQIALKELDHAYEFGKVAILPRQRSGKARK